MSNSFAFENNVTYQSEGNNNPKSRWYSRKFHHPTPGSGVTIGRGYDLSQRTANQIKKELTEAGFSAEKIEILQQGAGLTGKAADEFIKKHSGFEISMKEQQNLFLSIYANYQKETRNMLKDVWEKLPSVYQELLTDMRYRGDIKAKTKPFLLPAVKKIAEGDPSEFDKIMSDKSLWLNLGCDTNRIEMRRNAILNSSRDDISNASTNDSFNQQDLNFLIPKGGIDLDFDLNTFIKNPKEERFCGLIFDKKTDDFLLLRNPAGMKKKLSDKNMVNLEDLGVILKIFCDPTIKAKIISFSLDPFDKSNPQGPFMRKVFYPDQIEKRRILAGTKLGEDMFQADYIMKQMSLGIQPDNKSKFEYPEELGKLGLKPQHEMRIDREAPQEIKWSRAWIVVDDIKTYKTKENLLMIESVKMGVEARQMNATNDGSLKDSLMQDKNDECYKFSDKLGKIYDLTSKYYESFTRLKEITNAILMAKWICENNIPIDLELVNEIYNKNLIQNFQEKVPSISHMDIIESEEKVPVDMNDLAKRSLAHSKMEVTPANIEMALKQIKEKNPGKTFFDTKIKKQQLFVFGGVDLSSNIMKNQNEHNLFEEKKTEDSESSTKDGSLLAEKTENDFGRLIVKTQKKINVDLTEFNLKRFPFSPHEFCSICEKNLSVNESKINKIWRKMQGNNNYCKLHSPFSCVTCLKTILANYISLSNKNYHAECILCFSCGKSIKEAAMACDEGMLFHKECVEAHFKKRNAMLENVIFNENIGFDEEIRLSPEKEKRKSEEGSKIEKDFNKMQMKENEKNREIRGKTIMEKQPPLMNKAVKK